MGRSLVAAKLSGLEIDWHLADLTRVSPSDWRSWLTGVDVVVNAAGALQDGGGDKLERIHVDLLRNLTTGAAGLPVRIVQISAAGVTTEASTEFFRSKARGDALLSQSGLDHVILRPSLVLAREAYGGTALLRAAAALPVVQPRLFPNAPIQTVALDDVAAAVVRAAQGQVPNGTNADLTEKTVHSFAELIDKIRTWQGYPAPLLRPALPSIVLCALSRIADLTGHLGWKSPLRSTALRALQVGITGDPTLWEELGAPPCRALEQTLREMPATRQERLFARAYLAIPLAIVTLSVFWIASGLVPFLNLEGTVQILTARDVSNGLALFTVVGGAIGDVTLGLAILWRRWTRRAALGMILLSCGYILGSVIFAPDLWLDPLGPMVKVLPGLTLAALVALLVEER